MPEPYFATAAPGLDEILLGELQRLPGADPARLQAHIPPGGGGVLFQGELEDLYRANLHLRSAGRVLVRAGEFYAAAFSELRKKAGRLPWERYLAPGQPVRLSVTCRKSRLYHSDAVAERVAGAIGDRLGKPAPLLKAHEEDEDNPAQLVVVRLVRDLCTISVDSSGELLHRRGYRLATAKAPLRETLAAGMLLASGWDLTAPLLDPFCGSGTLPIEAALLAYGIPPGSSRRFAFMDWPGYAAQRWEALLAESEALSRAALPRPPAERVIIQGSDRDAGAIELAQANAARAGVAEWIEFSQRAVSAVAPPAGPGWVVTNPPYGVRVSEAKDLRDLYAQFGHVLRRACPGWRVAVLSSEARLLAQMGVELDTSIKMVNGGVNVRLGRGRVAGGGIGHG